MIRHRYSQLCWLLSTLLLLSISLEVLSADDKDGKGSSSITATVTIVSSTSILSTSTPPMPSPSPTQMSQATNSTVCSREPSTPDPCPGPCTNAANTNMIMAAVFGALMFISLVLCFVLLFILCCICSKRLKKETEIKRYVFEEGVQPPELWVDPNAVDEKPLEHQPDNWEVSTFSPSAQSNHTTMPLPDVKNTNGHVQPIPVQQPVVLVRQQKSSRYHPKRVAPPPPKKSKRKRFGRSKPVDETVYAVPISYLTPISQLSKKSDYDVPKSQAPHVYKCIDVSTMKPPSSYAGLIVGPKDN